MLSRRHFLGASLATTVYAAGSFVPVWAQNAPNFGTPSLPSPGFRRMKVGDVEVIALNDGITFGPGGQGFVRLNFGCPRATLHEGLERMRTAWVGDR